MEREQAELLARALRGDLAEARAGLDCTSTGELALHAHNYSSEDVAYWDAACEQGGCAGLEDEQVQRCGEEDGAGLDAAQRTPHSERGDGSLSQAVQRSCRRDVVAWQLLDVASEIGHDDGPGLDEVQPERTAEEAMEWDAAEAASEHGREEDGSVSMGAHAPHAGVEGASGSDATGKTLGGVQAEGSCAADADRASAAVEPEEATGECGHREVHPEHAEHVQGEPSAEQHAVQAPVPSRMQDISPPQRDQATLARTASPASSQLPPRVQLQLETLRCSFAYLLRTP